MLLSFAFRNFRSFAETADLTLTSSTFRTNVPRAGQTWVDATERVAAIYGPNASGKSTVLDAIVALSEAIRYPGGGKIFQPSKAHGDSGSPTEYEVEFVAQGVRHRYEVSAARWGIAYEALFAYPKSTARTIFMRRQDGADGTVTVKAGDSLTGPTAEVRRITKPKMLFLATANRYGHSMLEPVAAALLAGVGIDHIAFRDRQDEEVLHRVVMEMVAAPEAQVDLVKALVQTADLGIESIEVRSEEVPEEVRERVIRMLEALDDGEDVDEDRIPRLRDVLAFRHRTGDGRTFELPLASESSGTITWLTTVWHALDALRQGSILLVDELDASLHPDLARYVVELFLSPDLNTHGAQLIFTSHDVSLLGNAPTRLLQPRNVWFVEKNASGISDLFSQADFDNRSGNNSERRYLAGKFGAVPDIDDRLLLRFIGSAGQSAAISDG
ncbi:AAA family ATPase [Brachybacterium alimentarium]|uniref:AAA family ATPase n=1 Tax=Brachybacterium alimentarium TaxID=47845 RepID=UPI003FD0A7EC